MLVCEIWAVTDWQQTGKSETFFKAKNVLKLSVEYFQIYHNIWPQSDPVWPEYDIPAGCQICHPNWIRLAPNETNLGFFKDQFQYYFARIWGQSDTICMPI